ncbi:PREDICTED: ERI1 exoribonuclease 2 [Nicrophorus vespilloides]|uniref:ERI1 exoribonuclease 2 n=1 Tax=Nicrophorus vespilloides TaxID=110193 RepID=A0ABM1MWA4_NICVS|nr:PREDICTED: ERI1 exoribonuclease 2 [Nicrophorus vespilloides]
MATREQAMKLGCSEVLEVEKNVPSKYSEQIFNFLLVLDFEATCWNKNECSAPSEIIEFSVVLYDIKLCKILNQFQQYVMPFEYPKLSNFCTSLTGITQKQVDAGVPIGTCLLLFNNWLKDLYKKHKFVFDSKDADKKQCAFVTWSDWDLGICLRKECKRKNIPKSDVFNKWIDLRALYMEFYNRRPKGLEGALSEVGLKFVGKQHSGLDDAKNTAYLAGRMISEGVELRITKSISN